ncbi:hypothetical protein QEH52_19245 [Coraliomargarita sp. SDUM461003]|uniref:YcxB-like protein domain-containing protein n=1 Tax=Thalassobacterium maritimum TaxID=3041265 RepID=A0ABU1AZS5_9BACT|nr:hypothetical protein [Coraliomargarita sp. SDUM461003]MDQ8209663.1 hypothetical protein [Coraliomargarita sp. SDUM461003]
MEKEYSITEAQSKQMAWECFLAQSKNRKEFIKYLKVWAFLIASVYCVGNPAEWNSNGEHNHIGSIILTIVVQVPLCTVILYFILKFIAYAPQRALNKELEKRSDTSWGYRKFVIAPEGAKLIAPQSELKVSLDRIQNVKETENSISLNDGENPVFFLPKSDFDLSEVVEALNEFKTEPVGTGQPM